MHRSQILGLAALVLAAAVGAFLWQQSGSQPPPAPLAGGPQATGDPEPAAAPESAAPRAQEGTGDRRAVLAEADHGAAELDPEVRAALTGFRGRVVDHAREPVAGCGVRIYRFAQDSVLPPGLDVFGEVEFAPDVVAGESETDAEGRFLIGGVWPQALYLMFAGIGSDAPSHRMLPHTPAPGEILDLGDIVLNEAAVVTGTVVDEDDEPVPDALVRAVDLPGQITAFVPLERFDPAGCVLVRESGSPIRVVEMPPWVLEAWEHLPVPTTHTDAAGRFRLGGLVPGSNLVAVTKKGLLAHVDPAVRLDPGEVEDLGRIRLDYGEQLRGRVLDTAGEPVAGAEVVAGTTSTMVPVDFASHVGTSDAEGRFAAEGFGAGRITVAARRSPRDPWVMADPQPIRQEVVVTLPAVAALTVKVTGPDGEILPEPLLRLLAASRDEEAVVLSMLGLLRAVDLEGRRTDLEDGTVRVDDLPNARYVLLAQADGMSLASADVDLTSGPATVAVALRPALQHAVRVLGPRGEAIRSAAVYVEERGQDSLREMPFCAGRTNADGLLVVRSAGTESVRVSASHPRWGTVHGSTTSGQGELVLRMQEPGWIEGVLTDGGRPPAPATFTVFAHWRPEQRGAIEDMPALATPDLQGAFAFPALQPGRYQIEVIRSLEALTSPGGVMAFAQSMMLSNELPSEEVQVVSGEGAQVRLDAGKDEYTGPTGHVFGSVTIDGVLAGDSAVQADTSAGRRVTRVDAAGRFDFGELPVGKVSVHVMAAGDAALFGNRTWWRSSFDLAQGQQVELAVAVSTTTLAGMVVRMDGSPAGGVHVRVHGRPLEGKAGGDVWEHAITDADGAFRVDRMPEGIFSVEVEASEEQPQRGRLDGVRATSVEPALALRLRLREAVLVAGRVEASSFAQQPQRGWIEFKRPDPQHPADPMRGDHVTGTGFDEALQFDTRALLPGTYHAVMHVHTEGKWERYPVAEPLVVPPGGIQGVVLHPVRRDEPRRNGG